MIPFLLALVPGLLIVLAAYAREKKLRKEIVRVYLAMGNQADKHAREIAGLQTTINSLYRQLNMSVAKGESLRLLKQPRPGPTAGG